ncbi:Lipopolysaccharide choline phosphotransferase protein [Fasciolopsis buskii]|uniref:Lipopolysaccharide choline phosphotransferase protein n=1 Tax=Fasciolopsis buskii TaxID=27845 RepID=A0A8E0SB53_9TREM|nr:Lipopolysaccharide choline phosphotransferase protein [Fasciolopsis buski]
MLAGIHKTSNFLSLFKLIVVISIAITFFLWIYYLQPNQYQFISSSHPSSNINRHLVDVFLVKRFLNQTPWDELPNLNLMQWPQPTVAALPAGRLLKNKTRAPIPLRFDPVISLGQRRVNQKLLLKFAEVMDHHGYSDRYFLSSGTMIGSFRHHDFVPWDDDLDITVDGRLRAWLQKALADLGPEYRFVKSGRDKLFTRILPLDQDNETDVELSRQTTRFSWGWPFLDISYYDENETHVTELQKSYGRYYCWPKEVVFPLLYRPFGKNWFPTPRNPLQSLIESHGRSHNCETGPYTHVFEKGRPAESTRCILLGSRYAFVQRRPCLVGSQLAQSGQNMLVEERLILRATNGTRKVIHSLCLASDLSNANADTYGLDFIE